MATKLKIGLLVGSTGEERMASRVLAFVESRVAKEHDVTVFDTDTIDFPKRPQSMHFMMQLPNIPQNIKDLNDKIKGMDGFVIICPEYNWSLPPGLTTLMDNVPPITWCWKPCAFVHYSIGPVGGWRVGMQLRSLAGALGLMAVPKQMGIPVVQNALTADGKCGDDRINKELDVTLGHLYWCVSALKAHAKSNPAPQWSM